MESRKDQEIITIENPTLPAFNSQTVSDAPSPILSSHHIKNARNTEPNVFCSPQNSKVTYTLQYCRT